MCLSHLYRATAIIKHLIRAYVMYVQGVPKKLGLVLRGHLKPLNGRKYKKK